MGLVLLSRRWLPFSLVVLVVSAACLRLGIWQLDRLSQRRISNTRTALIRSLPTVSLPSAENLSDQEYRAARAVGVFDFERQVALRNQARGSEYGYHLLTPLLLSGDARIVADSAVLVDRGWIPAAGNEDPQDWRRYDTPGVVTVTGLVRLGQGHYTTESEVGVNLASDQPGSRFVMTVDPARLSDETGYPMPSYYIQATVGVDDRALPAAATPILDLGAGPHLGYAIQWFSFAIVLTVGYGLLVKRQETRGT